VNVSVEIKESETKKIKIGLILTKRIKWWYSWHNGFVENKK
jgi:hypothetical protein